MGLFTRKSFDALQAEAERGLLRRSLGPWNLTALGIGSIIGTGIFVLTGTAASQNAGPALVLSMIISAVGCAFAGLCYAEFAAMVPVAGSAYTYAYATVGELFAWIIGWDLILEYALSVSTVAVGWSGYFVSLARDLGITIPASLAGATGAAAGVFNLPAAVIVAARVGAARHRHQAVGRHEHAARRHQGGGARGVRRGRRGLHQSRQPDAVHPAEHRRVRAFGWSGVLRGRGRDVLRLYRLRRGVDGGTGSEEPVARHADRHPVLAGHLHGASTSPWRSCCSASSPTSS